MNEMDDIYRALQEARFCAQSLETWQRSLDGRDMVRSRAWSIERGIAAHERLSKQLKDGQKHTEMPDDFKPTGCMCSWPTVSPPCSWCTNPENHDEEEA